MLRIIALDPGGTTGWFTYSANPVEGPEGAELYDEKWDCGWLGPEEHHKELYTFLGMQQVTQTFVVCESFEYRNRARPGLELISKEYIGLVRLFCEDRKAVRVMQTAAVGKGFGSDEKLQRLGLLQTPKTVSPQKHINDAARHLVTFICTSILCPVVLRERVHARLRPNTQ